MRPSRSYRRRVGTDMPRMSAASPILNNVSIVVFR
jgi:hypothetical protein